MNYWLIMLGVPFWSTCVISASVESHLLEETAEITINGTTELIESVPPKEVAYLSEDNFSEHVKDGNYFVKFYAPWCAHSFRLEPIWNKIADFPEFDGKVSLTRVDCDDNKSLCRDYDIKGYPTLIWLKNGKAVRKYAGTRTYRDIISFIREMIDEDATTE